MNFIISNRNKIPASQKGGRKEKKENGKVIVVAATEQIERFFKEYTDFKVIRIKVHPDLITTKTKHKKLPAD